MDKELTKSKHWVLAEEKSDGICTGLEQSTQQVPYLPWRDEQVSTFQVSSLLYVQKGTSVCEFEHFIEAYRMRIKWTISSICCDQACQLHCGSECVETTDTRSLFPSCWTGQMICDTLSNSLPIYIYNVVIQYVQYITCILFWTRHYYYKYDLQCRSGAVLKM